MPRAHILVTVTVVFAAIGALLALYAAIVVALIVFRRMETARAVAGFIPDCAVLFARLLRDRRVPRRHKLLVALLLPYLASPIDLVPDFIPIAGQLDDAILVAFVLRIVAKRNAEAVRELWPGPSASLAVILRGISARPRFHAVKPS